jgi:hypothetical protein
MSNKKMLAISVIGAVIGSLLIPVFGQWYEQQTGIDPIAFYIAGGIASLGNVFYWLVKTVENL